jgi:AraC family transcriptional activator of pobA
LLILKTMSNDTLNIHFKSITEFHQLLGIYKPRHPLFSVTRFEDYPPIENDSRARLISDFYQITLKTGCSCKIQYGQTMFDFDEGVISCFAPKQVTIIEPDFALAKSGWQISIHPDFLRGHYLNQKIQSLGFFDYSINEALKLSKDEQHSIEVIIRQLEKEYLLPIDNFSQDLIIANLDVLLSYFNHYYTRQFITRKNKSNNLLEKFEQLLLAYFTDKTNKGLPTASYMAAELHISSKYLSDVLKQLTGQTTQQLIQQKIIEQAKDILSSTDMTVSEIAYQLGFEYPQSFSKLFKNKTRQTPNEYRSLFN